MAEQGRVGILKRQRSLRATRDRSNYRAYFEGTRHIEEEELESFTEIYWKFSYKSRKYDI